jgi:porin
LGLAVALVALLGAAGGTRAQEAPAKASPVPEKGDRGVDLSTLEKAVELQFEADGELLAVLVGGLRRGSTFDAAAQAAVSMDTAPLGLWQGGRLLGSGIAIRGGDPDRRLVGDLQVTSNIAATSASRVYELWYRQRLSHLPVAVRAGLIDLNQYFAVTDSAAALFNSSFGIMPAISGNAPTSIFPKPGFGAMVEGGSPRRQLLVGLFQGNPANRASALHQGGMAIAELDLHGGEQERGVLRLGAWRHTGAGDGGPPQWGAYGLAERDLAAGSGRHVRGFLQLGAAPSQQSRVPAFLGAGVMVTAPFASRPEDTVTLGLARAWLRHACAETSYELTYVAQLARHLELQPDLQLVTHPSGVRSVPDALVATLRLHVGP